MLINVVMKRQFTSSVDGAVTVSTRSNVSFTVSHKSIVAFYQRDEFPESYVFPALTADE